jgi:hypothetical protein
VDSNPKPRVLADFFSDVAAIVGAELTAAGYSGGSSGTAEEVVRRYRNVARRRISAKPRTVLAAKELQCPPSEEAGFQLVCEKARKGENLRPHQSRKLADPDFDDSLLNDWGINHLHLGTTLEPDGFMTRTGPVLLARVTANEFYCIAIMTHGKGHHPWSKQQLLDIIHHNWPKSIASWTLRGLGLEWNPSDEDVRKLRAAGVNVITQRPDGTIHAPLGGGVATDGSGIAVTNDVISLRKLCTHLEQLANEKLPALFEEAERMNVKIPPPYHFHLKLEAGRTRAIEETTQAFIDFGPALLIEHLA